MGDPLRHLPSVDRLLRVLRDRGNLSGVSQAAVVTAVRQVLEEHRAAMRGGLVTAVELGHLVAEVESRIRENQRPSLRRVINASGVLLHTNLGRAPLAEEAVGAVLRAAGSCNLELDLSSGVRGSRLEHVAGLLQRVTGAEAAVVVNNNAAAVLLTLSALAAGREVVVARSEQVEIGGSFRIPDVMRAAGVRLVEVGTTNRVRLSDYESALGPETALLLKVHRSNFRLVGFVSDVPVRELAELGKRAGIPVVYDLGSGCLVDLRDRGLPYEPTAPEAVRDGCDLVLFSGDKLLGGPQAGIAVGRAHLVGRLRTHPLYRAMRSDKLTLAALEATLRLYLDPEVAWRRVPILRMLTASEEELRVRAQALAQSLSSQGIAAEVVPSEAEVGGGSLPGTVLRSWSVRLRAEAVAEGDMARRLRAADPPVLSRVHDGAVLLDLRSVLPEDDRILEGAVVQALAP